MAGTGLVFGTWVGRPDCNRCSEANSSAVVFCGQTEVHDSEGKSLGLCPFWQRTTERGVSLGRRVRLRLDLPGGTSPFPSAC